MMVINFRQGIGFDIEYNEDICHIVDTGGEKHKLYSYQGAIILLPFIKIYLGNFEEIGEET